MPSFRKVKAYSRAGYLLLKTPMTGALLPRRLSGGKRSVFSFRVFSWEIWKTIAKRKKASKGSYLAVEAFAQYIKRIDELMDRLSAPSLIQQELAYRRDPEARKLISKYVGQVKWLPLLKDQKKEIFNLSGNFRRHVLKVMGDFEKIQNPTFTEVLKMKKQINGEMAKMLFGIFNVSENVPIAKRAQIEQAFSDMSMAGQIMDDIFDVKVDMAKHVPNLCTAALGMHLEELQRVADADKISFKWFRKSCPKTNQRLMNLFENYLERIPNTPEQFQVMAAIPRLFMRILLLTNRKK